MPFDRLRWRTMASDRCWGLTNVVYNPLSCNCRTANATEIAIVIVTDATAAVGTGIATVTVTANVAVEKNSTAPFLPVHSCVHCRLRARAWDSDQPRSLTLDRSFLLCLTARPQRLVS